MTNSQSDFYWPPSVVSLLKFPFFCSWSSSALRLTCNGQRCLFFGHMLPSYYHKPDFYPVTFVINKLFLPRELPPAGIFDYMTNREGRGDINSFHKSVCPDISRLFSSAQIAFIDCHYLHREKISSEDSFQSPPEPAAEASIYLLLSNDVVRERI